MSTHTKNNKHRSVDRDAIGLLKADHEKVRALLGKLEETTSRAASRRQEILRTIERELKIHTKIEEDIFYPAFRQAAEKQDDRKLYYEALEEHHVVDSVLPEIKRTNPASDEFGAKAKVLKDLVEHHAGEEESEMFPRARKLMEREELIELGARMMEEKESLAEGGRRAMAGSR